MRTAPALTAMLNEMQEKKASDLYLTAGGKPKFSLHGNFADVADHVLTPAETHAYAMEIMSEKDKQEFAAEKEVNLSHTQGEKGRFRVNVYTQRDTVGLVIRLITVDIPRLDQLGLPPTLGELIMAERGLLLVTGATGSGKSTTLAAMIDYRNERVGGHIITIEDPIEFIHPNKKSLISQREVGIDTKSFHMALKNSLRQAPKVIYIGEIRDTDTMGFAMHASETGHLVLGTLHSNNANQTLERIMNFFPQDYHEQLLLQLSLNIRAILSQRLLRKSGGGRVPALEIMLNTPLISELIMKGEIKQVKTAMAHSTNDGCQTFDHAIYMLWKAGLVSEEEAFLQADSANNLRLKMKGIGMGSH